MKLISRYFNLLNLFFCLLHLLLSLRVRATDRHCRQMRRNNKFGAKNMNLATTICEKKSQGKIFVWRRSVSYGFKSLPPAA